jgi:ATP/maltotriose-dependent transcriptional regulator MalT
MCLKAAFLNNIMSDTAAANRMIEKAISCSRSHKNLDLEAYAYYTRSNWLNWVGYTGTAVTEGYIRQSRDLYKKLGNKVNEAYMLKCLADFHYGQNKFGEALKELFEALHIYKEAGFNKLHYTYDLIGTAYY